jgi:hypothetical protein
MVFAFQGSSPPPHRSDISLFCSLFHVSISGQSPTSVYNRLGKQKRKDPGIDCDVSTILNYQEKTEHWRVLGERKIRFMKKELEKGGMEKIK